MLDENMDIEKQIPIVSLLKRKHKPIILRFYVMI